MDLLEDVFHWLLGVPYFAHVLNVIFGVHSIDTAIREKEMIKDTLCGYVRKPTMSLFKISRYIGSNTVSICFLTACSKVLYALNV